MQRSPNRPSRRAVGLVRRGVLAAAALLCLCAVWTAIALLSVRDDLEQAREVLAGAREADDVATARPGLVEAEDRLDRASSRLRAPGPALIGVLPLVGRPVRGVERAATAGLEVVRGTRAVLDIADPGGARILGEGRVDVTALRALSEALDEAARRSRGPVEDLVAAETGAMPGSVADPLRAAQDELAPLPRAFDRAARAVRALSGVLGADEPRQLLLVLENNAELRGTGGIVTVYAEAVADGGRVDVGPFRDVKDVAADADDARRVDAPADYRRLWGQFLADTTLWKNTNMSPDVPTSSAVLAGVADAAIGRRPTAVVWLDVPAIAAVLEATGPAELEDGTVLTADNAVRTLLSDAYRTAPDDLRGQAQRRAQLRGVADAVLDRIVGGAGATSASALGLALAESAAGRHLKLWSAEADEQADLVAGGLAGEVAAGDGDLTSFVVQNFGGGGGEGNKLDYYARRQTSVTVELGLEQAVVRQEVALRSTVPRTGLPRYVAGFETPGVLNSYVTLALPRGAALLEFSREGRAVKTELLPEGDHQVVTDSAALAPGTTATWVLRYVIPVSDGRYRLVAVPQPLAVDSGLRLEVVPHPGLELHGSPTPLVDGRYLRSGPYSSRVDLDLTAVRPGLLTRTLDSVRRFWSRPLG